MNALATDNRPVGGAKLIDGKTVALKMRDEQRARVEALQARGVTPGLAVVLVGEDPASAIYVSRKVKACEAVGIKSISHRHPATITNEELLVLIGKLNADPNVHGILVQLPLPKHIDMEKVLETIAPEKDVDGFHLYNVGALVVGRQVFPPCTPYGVMNLLKHEGIPIEGRNVVVVGASNIVGKPMALMLMANDATVAICHAKTRDLGQWTILADILVVAAGVPNLIVPQMVKTGVVVIDVGINRLPDGRVVGDVDFEGVSKKASHITPVPGGVGPMTIAMLLENTIQSAERIAANKEG
ncbi:methylenetetrahydrofolate dehydrogenase (NADP+)/methenyltetrahydrofolate cyclohydrolase [Sphingobium sp. B2D3A]|uniref:bifunctional methylenetetrahydrofolate dehydrogenase/methenyltetrahydrofolate cyclohydrolase FolD n=1 Tax=Sphingobium TaxID=165695 RepID=UPI001801461D|nr:MULTISPECIES: bifunctional methylenetetrahydrofolate dehydrogenase/methenyltetrahydrofolate cyclohydrolase FolD [Sphingobium]MCW2338127.1 methylenetetrahydrofolate dehydrogenase (NADP+)/methenyltetrahydrofolate cyclohydrolase [Sphingobium sp. B2D3A]MCW2350243.1 methylenetetrahydrofolate dehydrogenase (NADP+)/methenyltetrahydrofolate cyclohydrolase [Sphingobium sp. B12D2B]MCW2366546.1 methylenetetrahydrofolate dehydrogenase (NADP+)/methenyltetrahydrofolate cyclohydrolase [Sphingobium sp. B7D2B